MNDVTLKSAELQIERKTFIFLLKENQRGRLLRIIEQTGRSSVSIIVPASGLPAFQNLLAEILKNPETLPPTKPLP